MKDHMLLRRETIRKKMMTDFRTGGKRVKALWIKKWFNAGDGQFPMSYMRQALIVLLGVTGIADFIVTGDFTKFTILFAFIVCYAPFALGIGFLYHWFDFATLDTYIARILDPMYYDIQEIRKGLNVKSRR